MSDFGWWSEHTKEEAMKVQPKQGCGGFEYEVVEESANYYLAKDPHDCGAVKALNKAYYEPVQEWMDVTHECALLEDGYGRYSLFHKGCAVEASNERYKVTKEGAVAYKVEVKK